MKSTILASLFFPALALCQYGAPAAPSSTTTAASTSVAGSVPTIVVAQNGLTFSPNSVTAPQGGQVVFQFAAAGHTVTQADFDSPCVPSNASGAINSGLSSTGSGPQSFFTVDITSTDPIWFFCAQVSHCQSGMVGVINPPASGNTITQFAAAAKNVPISNNIPSNVQGGTFGQPSTTASATASATAKPNAAPQLMNQETVLFTVGLVVLSLWFSRL